MLKLYLESASCFSLYFKMSEIERPCDHHPRIHQPIWTPRVLGAPWLQLSMETEGKEKGSWGGCVRLQ